MVPECHAVFTRDETFVFRGQHVVCKSSSWITTLLINTTSPVSVNTMVVVFIRNTYKMAWRAYAQPSNDIALI